MEPRKLKKLVLKKETIASLSNHAQNSIRGGESVLDCLFSAFAWTLCGEAGSCPPATCPKYGGGDGGGNYGGDESRDIVDCPNHSQVGSGCDAETCGWAWTCNG
jgi:hypothetical protein